MATFVLFAAMGAMGGLSDVRNAAVDLPAGTLALFFGAFVVNTLCRAGRWLLGVSRLGLPVSYQRMFLFYMAGFALAATPGKVGTAIRLWLLKNKQGIGYGRSTPLFVLDQLTDFTAYLILLAIGLSALIGIGHVNMSALQMPLLALMGLGIVGVLFSPKFVRRCIKGTYALCGKRAPRVFGRLLQLQRHIHVTLGGRTVAMMLILVMIGWLAPVYSLFHTLNDMGVEASFSLVSGLFALVVVVGVLSFLPGGAGVTEAGLAAALVMLGASLPLAVVLTALMRFFTLWIAVFIGLGALPVALKLPRQG